MSSFSLRAYTEAARYKAEGNKRFAKCDFSGAAAQYQSAITCLDRDGVVARSASLLAVCLSNPSRNQR